MDLEIDGSQHFESLLAIQHDKERDFYLNENGWRIYRLSWLELNIDTNKMISDFINFLKTNTLYRTYNRENLLKYLKNKNKPPKYGSLEKYFNAIKEKII